ncbi:uncharacterized protein LOC124205588 [Daphnia pulex]|uniref:uncharacterized protein LOC124205588 n=1 Tax=Daphnia pulex TaxID=6669 RepID=UPI001EDD04A6|nr:uncharacterized protein LOC124205588 [Daphnia pulex]
MSKLLPLLTVAFVLMPISRACNNNKGELFMPKELGPGYYWTLNPDNVFGGLYRQLNANVPAFPGPFIPPYQRRTFQNSNKRPPLNFRLSNKYFPKEKNYDNNQQAEGRLALGGLKASLINAGLFNNRFTPANTWRPFSNLANKSPVSLNPNLENSISTFDGCTSPNGESGICAPGNICALFGGRPSGSCLLGKVCCINAISKCGASVTLNNTFWQSPATISAPSTCSLTVKLDAKYLEQKMPICQVRLDFISFTTAQPTAGTCTETFQVSGSINPVPIICGDNSGQHMYLNVPSSDTTPTDVRLMFNFLAGAGSGSRSWKIKIAMLPCGASYLAPKDCLQFFSSSSGTVKSFNWMDVAGAATRQLNNQNYDICFRTAEVNNQVANRLCVSVCAVTNGGDAFSITSIPVLANTANSAVGTVTPNPAPPPAVDIAVCLYDFLLIAQGTDPATGVVADRFCGNQLNPALAGAPTSVLVCTRTRPFRLTYQTDNTEGAVVVNPATGILVPAFGDAGNVGFCLDFQQRTN